MKRKKQSMNKFCQFTVTPTIFKHHDMLCITITARKIYQFSNRFITGTKNGKSYLNNLLVLQNLTIARKRGNI